MIEDYKDDDRKIAAWIDFAKRVARKDKRNRKQISLKNYFLKLQKIGNHFFQLKALLFLVILLKMYSFKV